MRSCLFPQVVVQVTPVLNPMQPFPIGTEFITYTATDRTGNKANCSFTVTVVGEIGFLVQLIFIDMVIFKCSIVLQKQNYNIINILITIFNLLL